MTATETRTDPGRSPDPSRRLRRHAENRALSPSKLLVLGVLVRRRNLAAAELAELLRIRPQSLTRLLAALADDGLIDRLPDTDDRRRIELRPTPAGEAALAADMDLRRDRLARAIVLTLTTAEREVLDIAAGLMERVAAAVAGNDDDGA